MKLTRLDNVELISLKPDEYAKLKEEAESIGYVKGVSIDYLGRSETYTFFTSKEEIKELICDLCHKVETLQSERDRNKDWLDNNKPLINSIVEYSKLGFLGRLFSSPSKLKKQIELNSEL